mmetsp:Transcript_25799/g.65090  ORF Transcript_25799/g.65090 Transcript_25799/m.65090 type:complete len:463 (+) Transcript_25799:214-1602(+)
MGAVGGPAGLDAAGKMAQARLQRLGAACLLLHLWAVQSGSALPAGVAGISESDAGALTRPSLVLFYHSGHPNSAAALERLADVGRWARSQGVDVGIAAIHRAAGGEDAPLLQCLHAGSQTSVFSGSMEPSQLREFAARSCQVNALARGSFPALDKYSADPARHDAEFLRMARPVGDDNYKSITRGRNTLIFVGSGMCALCKILRPAYNRIAAESALVAVQKLHMQLEAAQATPAASHVRKAPAVLFLHAGTITAQFELKPSKDTAQYAARLVAWARRMQAMKGSPAEVDAARALHEEQQALASQDATPRIAASFYTLFPSMVERQARMAEGEGVLVLYHTEHCWQREALAPLWQALAREGVVQVARHQIGGAGGGGGLGSQHCDTAFCAVYWRGRQAVARFKGTFDHQSLRKFWADMEAMPAAAAAELATTLGRVSRTAELQHEARVLKGIKTKARTVHTEL